MKDGNKFKLIESPPALGNPNNFWRVCPRLLKYLPESNCHLGKPEMNSKSNRVQEEPSCPWWINSPDYNYCFWKYVHDKSNSDGVMPELVQSELAQLFGWSNTKTHFVLKESMEELSKALETYGAIQLFNDMTDEEYQELLDDSDIDISDPDDYNF